VALLHVGAHDGGRGPVGELRGEPVHRRFHDGIERDGRHPAAPKVSVIGQTLSDTSAACH
jgi:hypothetical protein